MDNHFKKSKDFKIKDDNSGLILSNQYEVKRGGFGKLGEGLETYFCSLKVEDLKDDIITFKKLTEGNIWPVSQIIQREINWTRVSEISSHYIRAKGRDIKYFPPITIAILPKDEEGNISKEYDYEDQISEEERESLFRKSKYSDNIGVKKEFLEAKDLSPLKAFWILNLSEPFDYNILCWDKTKYNSVVIDGQHRYEALLQSAESEPEIYNYIQDVVFLDISKLLKTINQEPDKDITPVRGLRTVFVDINNNAELITPVRRILMDDKDLASLFVQSIVDDEDDDDSRTGEYIQPQLIDWHVESYKHDLPHITSILVLYQLMTDYVLKNKNLSSIDDLRDENRIKSWISIVNEKFRVDELINKKEKYSEYTPLKSSLIEYEDILEEKDDDEISDFIFSYDYRTLSIAQETFEKTFREAIVKCFYEITPYRKVKDYLESEGAFNEESTLYRALVSTRAEVEKKSSYQNEFSRVKKELKDSFEEKYQLIYTVLGQKALFELFFKRIDYDYDKNFSKDNAITVADNFISDINEIFDIVNEHSTPLFGPKDSVILSPKYISEVDFLGTLASSFWEGIIYREKRIIYNTRGVSSLRSIFEYIIQFTRYYKSNRQPLPKEDFHINYLESRLSRSIKRQFEELEDQADSLAKKIVEAKRHFLNDYLIELIEKNKE